MSLNAERDTTRLPARALVFGVVSTCALLALAAYALAWVVRVLS